ncbi:MAG TPA: LuxR C-terminal-related transcriptional regulator [Dehalococcoidia bacterium]|nr:LuxR C-terminal-related transcriptional regulator [Dehalococcoidia bacterium]
MTANKLLDSIFRTEDGVFAVDPEQRIVFWNQGAEAILGYSPHEVAGKLCFEILQGTDEAGQASCTPDCPIMDCARRGTLGTGKNLRVTTKDGTFRWLSITHTFMGLPGDHPLTVVHIFRDVTPEMEAKRLLGRITQEIAEGGFRQDVGEKGGYHHAELTERETEVLTLLARGEGTRSIARRLMISNTTANNHIQNILAKLGVHTRLEAVVYALRHHLVSPG